MRLVRACAMALLGLMVAATAGSQTMLDTLFDKLRTATKRLRTDPGSPTLTLKTMS